MNYLSITSFLGFTLLAAFIARYATRKTDEKPADGSYLGVRSIDALPIAGSLLSTNLSAEQIDITPWKYAQAFGIAIVILVLSTYFIF
jgi:SSS family solute:Na+ symporter